MRVGTVKQIWRYPVKSMGGETVQDCQVGERGLGGDRGWALRDETAGEIRGAKKLPELLECTARYLDPPANAKIPHAEITLPDGAKITTDQPGVSARLSELVGRPVTLWPLQPASDLEHYRRGKPDDADPARDLRAAFGLLEDEPLPDLSGLPQEIFQFTSPPGTYFDAYPLHLVTTASLEHIRRERPQSPFDVRRFRPNFLVEPVEGAAGFVELEWCGRTLRIGGATVQVEIPTVRCAMTTHAQRDLPPDPSVMRALVRHAKQNLGVYASVLTPGAVAVGDPVELL
ncbi:MAG: MOSC domain-containing protein [Dehalococcoidia bacterium]